MVEEVAAMRASWIASLTEEERAALMADNAAPTTEDDKAMTLATFKTCDTNENGVLCFAEFCNFMKCVMQNDAARGVPGQDESSVDEAMKQKVFDVYNAATADTDGVSLEDFATVTAQIGAAVQAILAGQ